MEQTFHLCTFGGGLDETCTVVSCLYVLSVAQSIFGVIYSKQKRSYPLDIVDISKGGNIVGGGKI